MTAPATGPVDLGVGWVVDGVADAATFDATDGTTVTVRRNPYGARVIVVETRRGGRLVDRVGVPPSEALNATHVAMWAAS